MELTELTGADVLEITNLIADYLFAIDERDAELFRELWAEDAVYRLTRDAVGLGTPLHGREAIVAGFAAYFAGEGEHQPGTFVRHHCTNLRIGVVDGEVTAKCGMMSILQQLVDGVIRIGPNRTGVYSDRLVREDGRWRFVERTLSGEPPERDGVDLPAEIYGPLERS